MSQSKSKPQAQPTATPSSTSSSANKAKYNTNYLYTNPSNANSNSNNNSASNSSGGSASNGNNSKEEAKPEKPVSTIKLKSSTGFAIVKSVLSGDSLILIGAKTSSSSSAPEKQLTLSGILAPKFARSRDTTDEPFAFEAREFLRTRLVGQQVKFVVNAVTENGQREYGNIFLNDESVTHMLLRAGWAKVKPPKEDSSNDDKNVPQRIHPDKQELLDIQNEAIQLGLGMHVKGAILKNHVRVIDWNVDSRSFINKYKGQPIEAIVDYVNNGSTLRCELIHDPVHHSMITLYLAGVVCPRTPTPLAILRKRAGAGEDVKIQSEPAEPFALEAQAFTELRLLQRSVQVVLQGIDAFGNLFGSVVFTKGNITLKLLESGLGKYVGWQASLTGEAAKLKEAEAAAKKAKLKRWANWTEGQGDDDEDDHANEASMTAKVYAIHSADSITVIDSKGEERRLYLASIRAPRLGRNGAKDEPYAREGYELLRSKLIGKKIRVAFEYSRAGPTAQGSNEDKESVERDYVSLFYGKINVADELVKSGFATVVKHRVDEPRASTYELLLQSELAATNAQRGLHAPPSKAPPVHRIIDLSHRGPRPKPKDDKDNEENDEAAEERETVARQTSAKSRQYFVFFQRDKAVNGIVEFAFSGSRLKVHVPTHHVIVPFVLAGLRTPNTLKEDGSEEPLAAMATAFTKGLCLQHDVKLEVETMDKGDNFIGQLFVDRKNLGVELLRAGLASLVAFSADRSPYKDELYAAEKEAKAAHRGLWVNYVEPTPEELAARAAAASQSSGNDDTLDDELAAKNEALSNGKELVPIKVTEIVDLNTFFVHFVGDKGIEFVDQALKTHDFVNAEPLAPPDFKHARGPIYAAGLFTDDSWYRVRVEECVDEEAQEYRVFFLDYGNFDILNISQLRTLPEDLSKVAPLARWCSLAGVSTPKNDDYRETAISSFSSFVWGTDLVLVARVIFIERTGRYHLVITEPANPLSVNSQLLQAGCGRLPSRYPPALKKIIQEFANDEKIAKDKHLGMFEYGDVSDDEEETNPAGPKAKKGPK